MSGQLSIDFEAPAPVDPRTLARRGDPETAHDAARFAAAHIGALHRTCLAAFREAGARGLTSYELAQATGIARVSVSGRCRELERRGLLVETPERRAGPSGVGGIVWRIV
jgi:hypothetical protein